MTEIPVLIPSTQMGLGQLQQETLIDQGHIHTIVDPILQPVRHGCPGSSEESACAIQQCNSSPTRRMASAIQRCLLPKLALRFAARG